MQYVQAQQNTSAGITAKSAAANATKEGHAVNASMGIGILQTQQCASASTAKPAIVSCFVLLQLRHCFGVLVSSCFDVSSHAATPAISVSLGCFNTVSTSR
jgi:hypothetical protein